MNARETRDRDEIDLLDYIRPLAPHWKLLLLAFFVGGVIAYLISCRLPKQYKSAAVVYVQQNSPTAGLLANLPVSIGSASSSNSGYIQTILQSESMRLAIIKKLDLLHDKRVFPDGAPPINDALIALKSMIAIEKGESGAITVTVTACNPKMAADMANSSVDLLGSFVVTASQKKAEFTAKNIEQTLHELNKAENDMKDFMLRYDVSSLDDQTKGMITQLVQLEGDIVTMQAQLAGITSQQQNASDLNRLIEGEVQRKSAESSVEYMRKQRDALRKKLEELPAIGAKYADIQRRIVTLNKTYEVLTEQYQLARVTQKGENGDYQIIDRARPNPMKVAPSNAMNAAVGGLCGFLLAAIGINIFSAKALASHRTRQPRQKALDDDTPTPAKRG